MPLPRRKTLALIAASALLILIALASWRHWKQTPTPHADPATFIGKPAPDFALKDLNGRTLRLSDLRGKAVLLNFWATWCGPCMLETPWLSALRDKYARQGFEVVGISTEGEDVTPNDSAGHARQLAAVRKFVALTHPSYPILLDGDSICRLYGDQEALPTSFYLNKEGVIVAVQMGLHPGSEIEADIRKALAQQPAHGAVQQ
jgi:cytochrome c biogenesis protein CcmG/thiol:disulfide interchange protein DsbE